MTPDALGSGWGDGPADAFGVVLVGDAGGEMARAVVAAGGLVLATLDFDATLVNVPGALVVVDAGAAGDGPLDALDALAGYADIVACDLDQLDRVAGALLLADADLLCAPTFADRVAALAMARTRARDPEGVREGDARLRRFSAEVGRIAGVLARLAESEGDALADRRPAWDPGPAQLPAAIDAAAVRQAIRARRLRGQFFGDGLFEDPAWDMLLDLFAAELEGGRVSVSSLCIAAHVAPTTALRWIGRMVEAELFERRPDPRDRRRAFMALTTRGSAAMRGYWVTRARE